MSRWKVLGALHCRRRLRHISPDQGPRLMCECKMKQFPWGRAVLKTKFEVDSSYNCVLRTLCPNAPTLRWREPSIPLPNRDIIQQRYVMPDEIGASRHHGQRKLTDIYGAAILHPSAPAQSMRTSQGRPPWLVLRGLLSAKKW